MPTFNDELLSIHQKISIKDEDRKPYTDVFERTKKWLIDEMTSLDPVFKTMCKGTELFGSYSNRVRIITPSEFDVFILLKFAFPIKLSTCPERAGFVEISSSCEMYDLESKNVCEQMFEKTNGITFSRLNNNKFQDWIESLIKTVIYKNRFPPGHVVQYNRCNVAHNIKLVDTRNPFKRISIDFVPAIMMHEVDISSIMRKNPTYIESFLAIPKAMMASRCFRKCRPYTFQLVNPQAEREILWDRNNLKVVYRLLKSIRDNDENLCRLKSYFLTAIFMLEVNTQSEDFWRKPVAEILLHMLKVLIEKFNKGFLPYYWEPQLNLLKILRPKEISEYAVILTKVYSQLLELSVGEIRLSVASHFKTDNTLK